MASSRAFSPDSTESPVADVPKVASQHCDLTPDATTKSEDPEKQPLIQVVCLIVSAFVAMFLVALDRTIISTVRTFHLHGNGTN